MFIREIIDFSYSALYIKHYKGDKKAETAILDIFPWGGAGPVWYKLVQRLTISDWVDILEGFGDRSLILTVLSPPSPPPNLSQTMTKMYILDKASEIRTLAGDDDCLLNPSLHPESESLMSLPIFL